MQKSSVLEDVSTGDYTARFEMATWISVILLSVIYFLTLLPSLKPKTFQPYSVKRGLDSFFISVLGLFSLLIWMTYTSIIAYEIEGETSAIVIVDTSPSFLPFIILSITYVVIKVIDFLVLILYESEFIALRNEKKHLESKILNMEKKIELKLLKHNTIQFLKCSQCGSLNLINKEICYQCEKKISI